MVLSATRPQHWLRLEVRCLKSRERRAKSRARTPNMTVTMQVTPTAPSKTADGRSSGAETNCRLNLQQQNEDNHMGNSFVVLEVGNEILI